MVEPPSNVLSIIDSSTVLEYILLSSKERPPSPEADSQRSLPGFPCRMIRSGARRQNAIRHLNVFPQRKAFAPQALLLASFSFFLLVEFVRNETPLL